MKNCFIRFSYITALLSFINIIAMAQGAGTTTPCLGDPDDANYDPNCPLDNSSILIIAAVVILMLAFYRINKQARLLVK